MYCRAWPAVKLVLRGNRKPLRRMMSFRTLCRRQPFLCQGLPLPLPRLGCLTASSAGSQACAVSAAVAVLFRRTCPRLPGLPVATSPAFSAGKQGVCSQCRVSMHGLAAGGAWALAATQVLETAPCRQSVKVIAKSGARQAVKCSLQLAQLDARQAMQPAAAAGCTEWSSPGRAAQLAAAGTS